MLFKNNIWVFLSGFTACEFDMSGLFMSVVKIPLLPQCKRKNASRAETRGNLLSFQFICKKTNKYLFLASTAQSFSVACYKSRDDWDIRYLSLFRLLMVNKVSFTCYSCVEQPALTLYAAPTDTSSSLFI